MYNLKKRTSLPILSSMLIGMILVTPVMAAKGHLNVTSRADKVITVTDQNGNKVKKRIPATKVIPGETVIYTTTFENISKEDAEDIGVTNPIPEHTVYLPGTASGQGCRIDYSVNGGKRWGQPNALKVRDQNGQWRPAKPSEYTHIRWNCAGKLQPHQRKAVSFQVRLL